MSQKDMCQLWRIMESLVCSSEACCFTFVESDGLRHLISTMTFCSNYEVNQSIINVVGHIANTKVPKQALQRQEVLRYLEFIGDSLRYKDKEVL